MSDRMKRNIDALRVLSKASPRLRKAILVNADSDLLFALCEIALNVINGTVRLTPGNKKALKKHQRTIRTLLSRRSSINKKRKILVQRGGFLSTLLVPAITLLTALLTK